MNQPKTVLITGATDGLGKALALRIAAEGADLILHGRDPERLSIVASEASSKGASAVSTVLADFAELDQVKALSEEVLRRTDVLDVLISNAGIGSGEPAGTERSVTQSGIELRFAVNYLAGFVLTTNLGPILRRSSRGRVINVSSLGQAPMDFDDPMIERNYSGTRAYGQSKLAQITAGLVFARQLAPYVTVNSLHPATYMPTKIVISNGRSPVDSLESGTLAVSRLATGDGVAGLTGKFFVGLRQGRALPSAYDPDVQRSLWDLSSRLTDLSPRFEPK